MLPHIMDSSSVTPTGVGVVIIGVTLILRLVFDFLVKMKEAKEKDGPNDKTSGGFTQTDRNKLYDLHRWHDRHDEDGVPVWYVRSGLESTVQELVKAMEHQVKTQEALTRAIEAMVRTETGSPPHTHFPRAESQS